MSNILQVLQNISVKQNTLQVYKYFYKAKYFTRVKILQVFIDSFFPIIKHSIFMLKNPKVYLEHRYQLF